MGIERTVFKSEEKKSAADIAAVLRQIADKLETGSLTLKKGNKETVLDFPSTLTLELKVEEKPGLKLKKSFEIELEWIHGSKEEGDGETAIL